MVSIRSLALLAAAGVVFGQEISSLQECGQTCYNNAVNEFAKYGCGAGEVGCLCKVPDWGFSIRDCAIPACGADYASTVTAAASALCATATVGPPPAAASSAPAQATSAPPAPTSAPPPAPVSSSSTSSVTATASPTDDAAKLASTPSTSSPTASASKTSSTSSSTSKTSAPASTSSDAAAAPPTAQAGMATATKIGLGVGLTAVGAACLGGAAWFFLRRRGSNSRQNGGPGQGKHWKISDPMPAHSGRAYAQDYNPSYETGLSELEMKSRRYEDMVPRAKPRHMV